MNRRLYLAATLLASAMFAAASNSCAQTTEAVAGRVLSVKCAASLKKNASASPLALKDPRDVGLGLAPGNQVRCDGTGYLEILLPEGTKKVIASQGWLIVQPIPAKPPFPEIAEALSRYGIPGATRGQPSSSEPSHILWPADNSAVVSDRFIIRWTPVPQKIVLTILSESKDVTLWGPTDVSGDTGSMKSDALDSALANYKRKNGSANLILTLSLANASSWEEVHFSILGGRQEQELNSQLDFWSKHTDELALHLGRGYSFSRHKLFAEAAAEYDTALDSVPESRYLLEQAIQANRLAGLPSRVKELQSRLASHP